MDKEHELPEQDKIENEEKLLNLYMRELVEIQDNRLLTREDLAKLDEKYPLSQQYKDKLYMLASRHIARAEKYKKKERWDTAIIETERALLFSPLDEKLRLDLAELYLNRSRQYGYLEKDLRRSDEKIRETLIIHPRSKSALKMQKEMLELNRILKGKDQNRKMIPIFLGILLIVAAVSYPRIIQFRFWGNDDTPVPESLHPAENNDWTTKSLQVETTDSLKERIDLDITLAEIEKRESGYGISLQGYTRTVSGPLEDMTLKVSLRGEKELLFMKTIPLLDREDPPLYPEETLPFSDYTNLTDYDNQSDELFIELESIRKTGIDPENRIWETSITQWELPQPEGIMLEFQTRREDFLEGYDAQYLFEDIRVVNKSLREIEDLQVTIHWLDESEALLASRELSLVPPGNPSIRGESIQTYRILLDLPKTQILPPGPPAVTIQQIEE